MPAHGKILKLLVMSMKKGNDNEISIWGDWADGGRRGGSGGWVDVWTPGWGDWADMW